VSTITVSRRHHAAVIMDNNLYLLGGYGKHRVVLDSMERVSLETGESSQCANLPQPVRRPAAAVWKGRLVAVVGGRLLQYNQHKDRWDQMEEPVVLPTGFQVDCAMADTAKNGGSLYLTSTCSRDLYRVSPSYIVEKLGSFSSEAGNTCMVAGILYNFYSEEFGDCRVVESYNTETGQFHVLFRKDLPKWDFSPAPQYSYGCFSLLSYDL